MPSTSGYEKKTVQVLMLKAGISLGIINGIFKNALVVMLQLHFMD